ncbi:hypothetical protein [Streptomyces sp. XY006]|uniref:hypothetical protein n=1 Tax=Streptomyces sp. XY006 TaxID=2021410 RepID=UPI000B8C6594|nr:hypothetical protein [Streptomyces sp. XY006]OXS35411.1 hypothetical protein CHR28_10410 [Streptomyces sp. XY006]
MTTDHTHGLSVQHADALWDAVAIPGPATPTFTEQHERVCVAVAEIIDEVTAVGEEPEQAALRDRIRRAVCEAEGFAWDSDTLEPDEYGEVADAVLAVLPPPVSRADVYRELADQQEQTAATDVIRRRRSIATARRLFAVELRRMADEAQPDDTVHACPGRWGGPGCKCFDDEAQPGTEAPADVRHAREALYTAATGTGRMPEHDATRHLTTLTQAAEAPIRDCPDDCPCHRVCIGRPRQPGADRRDDYEFTTGHLITCFAKTGGSRDPNCPCVAEAQPEQQCPVSLATVCTTCDHTRNWHDTTRGICLLSTRPGEQCDCSGFTTEEQTEIGEPAAGPRQDGAQP